MDVLVLASNNRGKLRELGELLQGRGLELRAQSECGVPEAEETGLSFVENAILKARNASRHSGLPAIADDSGLEVDALGGRPGIYSARFAGDNGEDADPRNNEYLLELLRDVPPERRGARYHCLLVLMRHAEDPVPLIVHGSWEGEILQAPQGDGGFGYDPLFYVPEMRCSAAELPAAEKNQRSHRGRALEKMLQALPEFDAATSRHSGSPPADG